MCFFSSPAVPALPVSPPAPPPPPPPPSPRIETGRDAAAEAGPAEARELPRPVGQAQKALRQDERRTALVASGPARATVLTSGRGVTTPGNSARRTLLGG